MRRAIGPAWPWLSYFFGLHPWHLEELTYPEIDRYMDTAQELRAAMRKQK